MSMDTEHTVLRGEGTTATLAFLSGAAHLAIHAGDRDHLLTARFSGPQPRISGGGAAVFVRCPSRPGRTTCELGLNPNIEWTIVAGRGAAHWEADLTGVDLTSIRIAGGASDLRLNLPRPARRVGIEITGGADRVTTLRPSGVGITLSLGRGASGLVFDHHRFKTISGGSRFESDTGDPVACFYQIRIGSGASRLAVVTAQHAAGAAQEGRWLE